MGILCIAALAVAALEAPSNAAQIATGDEDMFALEEEMVSTASRTAEPIRKAPASVTVVTAVAVPAAALAFLAMGVGACVTLEDRCAAVRCGEGEGCLDLADRPDCVCDADHEESETGACLAILDDGSESDG